MKINWSRTVTPTAEGLFIAPNVLDEKLLKSYLVNEVVISKRLPPEKIKLIGLLVFRNLLRLKWCLIQTSVPVKLLTSAMNRENSLDGGLIGLQT